MRPSRLLPTSAFAFSASSHERCVPRTRVLVLVTVSCQSHRRPYCCIVLLCSKPSAPHWKRIQTRLDDVTNVRASSPSAGDPSALVLRCRARPLLRCAALRCVSASNVAMFVCPVTAVVTRGFVSRDVTRARSRCVQSPCPIRCTRRRYAAPAGRKCGARDRVSSHRICTLEISPPFHSLRLCFVLVVASDAVVPPAARFSRSLSLSTAAIRWCCVRLPRSSPSLHPRSKALPLDILCVHTLAAARPLRSS